MRAAYYRRLFYSTQPFCFATKMALGSFYLVLGTFCLGAFKENYKVFHEDFSFLFNSYYNAVGKRVIRANRGLMTRPGVDEVYAYRKYVNDQMDEFLAGDVSAEIKSVIEIGLNHEQQHQELLVYDIKYMLGNQPTFPRYDGLDYQNKKFITTKTFTKCMKVYIKLGIKARVLALIMNILLIPFL